MHKADAVRLRHMLEAAREAISFLTGRTRPGLDRDRMLTLALVRCVEVIGEAAGKVSAAMKTAHPEIPWYSITAMRHRLIHGYSEVRLDRVWTVLCDDLSPLIATLEQLLPREGESLP